MTMEFLLPLGFASLACFIFLNTTKFLALIRYTVQYIIHFSYGFLSSAGGFGSVCELHMLYGVLPLFPVVHTKRRGASVCTSHVPRKRSRVMHKGFRVLGKDEFIMK